MDGSRLRHERVAAGDGIERVAPRARVHRMPGVSHWVQNEAPGEVNRVLIGPVRNGTRIGKDRKADQEIEAFEKF